MGPARARLPLLLSLAALLLGLAILFSTPAGARLRSSLAERSLPAPRYPSKSPERAEQGVRAGLHGATFEIRKWQVPADIVRHFSRESGAAYLDYDEVQQALEHQQVPFPSGSWAQMDIYSGTLKACNLRENLELIEVILSNFESLPKWVVDRSLFDTRRAPPSPRVAEFENKIRTIIIPKVAIKDCTLGEALAYLQELLAELDTTEPNPARRGIPITIQNPEKSKLIEAAATDDSAGEAPPASLENERISNLYVEDASAKLVLDYLFDSTSCRYEITKEGIEIRSVSDPRYRGPNTEEWHLSPLVVERMRDPHNGTYLDFHLDDPFAEPPEDREQRLAYLQTASLPELLAERGLISRDGASMEYAPETAALRITSGSFEMEFLERILATAAFDLSRERAAQADSE